MGLDLTEHRVMPGEPRWWPVDPKLTEALALIVKAYGGIIRLDRGFLQKGKLTPDEQNVTVYEDLAMGDLVVRNNVGAPKPLDDCMFRRYRLGSPEHAAFLKHPDNVKWTCVRIDKSEAETVVTPQHGVLVRYDWYAFYEFSELARENALMKAEYGL